MTMTLKSGLVVSKRTETVLRLWADDPLKFLLAKDIPSGLRDFLQPIVNRGLICWVWGTGVGPNPNGGWTGYLLTVRGLNALKEITGAPIDNAPCEAKEGPLSDLEAEG
jgi:hypothetical protein